MILLPVDERFSVDDDDISELVGEGGNELVPPQLLPTLPRLESWRWYCCEIVPVASCT